MATYQLVQPEQSEDSLDEQEAPAAGDAALAFLLDLGYRVREEEEEPIDEIEEELAKLKQWGGNCFDGCHNHVPGQRITLEDGHFRMVCGSCGKVYWSTFGDDAWHVSE